MKKVLSLVLAVVLAFGMATVAFAATPKITAIAGNALKPVAPVGINMESLAIGPDADAIKLGLSITDFTWENGTPAALTTSYLSSGSITAVLRKTANQPVVRDVAIVSDSKLGPVVRVRFIVDLVSVKDADFSYEVTLAYKGTKNSDTTATIAGTMKNPITTLSENDDTVYTGDGTIAEAEAYIKGVVMDLGSDIKMTLNMFDGGKYYAKAVMEITAVDQDISDKYPEIENIITMKTATNQGTSVYNNAKVSFNFGTKYYVYNADGKYIGLSSDASLPFSSKYYLAVKKIDMGDTTTATEESTAPVPTEPANPTTGGDDAVANANNNPSTGVNGFVNVAIVAGVVALAAAGAVSMKK